jgi:hypothetical protein
MTRLPIPGSDGGSWGTILNDFLSVEINTNGTLKIRTDGTLSAFYVRPGSGIPDGDLSAAVQAQLSQGVSAYQKPASGIPETDLAVALQAKVDANSTAVQSVNGVSGTSITLTPSDIGVPTELSQLTDVNASSPADNQVLSYDSTSSEWVPSTVTTTTVNDATTASKGIVELAGDLGGTASSPSVLKLNGVVLSGTPTSGQALIATNTTAASWVTLPTGGSSTLATDSDVSIASPSSNQALVYNNSANKWQNQTLSESDITNLTSDLAAKPSNGLAIAMSIAL